ncbi:urea carboxylase [Methylocella silvestris BL2]|uniref:Urea carboxylase n=1 Tax=Methylocella silvestris (strain DSM 15510 / CIP 108128 / LMG 27833 / NCIMB 13906 / BL2) TaxID=395965 RepID=B8EQ39_METSB|nr:5-oxoprolinase/urea amidolyase family protein [Methylocella silvestris]ACK51529.1 urea carboxylase [Methylocella silvestris BL2]
MFSKVLIANRGEIVGRVVRTLRKMGVGSVAVYSDADRFSPTVLAADEQARLGPPPAAQSYLNVEAVIAACKATGAEAVHPGYGFLSENPGFAERLAAEGIKFIGPQPQHMRSFGLKHSAREVAQRANAPLLPGSGLLDSAEDALKEAERIGYPVMLKSTAGGGGIGMQLCFGPDELAARFESVRRLGANNFGDNRVYLEKFVARARHVEVQIFGDGKGGVVALGERDCSLQRRNQKVIEETPAPGLTDESRAALREAAIALGQAVNYESAGTVEFVYDADQQKFYFLEVNTRLQVEHCVTEMVFGVDLVEWMVRQAAGEFALPAQSSLQAKGAAIEARVYAEDASKDFRPSTGLLTRVKFPDDVRVDGWIETGVEVSPYYDPLLAKVIAAGATREEAIGKLSRALLASDISGIESNLSYLAAILDLPAFRSGEMITKTLSEFAFAPRTVDVLAGGTLSSIQDWPGRLGYWNVGAPPSGPMDDRHFRQANRIVGNLEGAAGLELTLRGPTLKFNVDTVIALTGARMAATLDGAPVPYDQPVAVTHGQVLTLGAVVGPGNRTYLAIRNGFEAPDYLGSKATFALGKFGGHAAGTLRTGDVLRVASVGAVAAPREQQASADLSHRWEIDVLYGPHGAPDFFTDEDIGELFATDYEVHYNSARTGVRLIGPKPRFARPDGGEAGLHPSNIHDNAYAIGAVDFTGDMPIILGPDGPSLGGFVCPVVIVKSDLWKMGQLRPGDKVRFRPAPNAAGARELGDPILRQYGEGDGAVCCRRAGDSYLLIEFGPLALDLGLRLRAHLLHEALLAAAIDGVIDLTPGIRSLQLHYDPNIISQERLLERTVELERALPPVDEVEIESRIVHLPVSWNDVEAQLAMRKYQELVRPDAPWCPSNIEFIRRINGLDSIEAVRDIIFNASYLVMGLGDVYLGAPVATPIDPRHRLVTTKYNPARTWTPENAVGIGGAYMCVYGMEGPGGYQLFGRTIQMWNSWRSTDVFERGKPWLLRFFDQIRFYPVSGEELADAREAFPHGRYPLKIEPARFSLKQHKAFLADHAEEIETAQTRQRAAFEAERRRWEEQGLSLFVEDQTSDPLEDAVLPDNAIAVEAPMPGNVWKIEAAVGDTVAIGDTLVVLESMKMEIAIPAPAAGRIAEIACQAGRPVQNGQRLVVIAMEDAR